MSDYTTPAKVRATMGSTVAGADETVLERLITSASRQIDHYCNRRDGFIALSVATAREFAGTDEATMLIDECVAVTLVETRLATETSWTSWASTDWKAFSGDRRWPNFNGLPYHGLMCLPSGTKSTFPRGIGRERVGFRRNLDDDFATRQWTAPTVRVTAKWGYAVEVPADIETACIIQVARQFKRGQSAFQDATAGPDMGTLMYRKGLDPEVQAILKDGRYVRPRV